MKLPKELQNKNKNKTYKKGAIGNLNKIKLKDVRVYEINQLENYFSPDQENFALLKPLLSSKGKKELETNKKKIQRLIKFEIEKKIKELKNIFEKYNPIYLLHYICMIHTLQDPETYKETEDNSIEMWMEYALSFATSLKPNPYMERPNYEIFIVFEKLIMDIVGLCIFYYHYEDISFSKNLNLKSIRYGFIIRYLLYRGDSIMSHYKDLVQQLFTPHNNFLVKNNGFSTENILEFVDKIRIEIDTNLKPYLKNSDSINLNDEDQMGLFKKNFIKHLLESGDLYFKIHAGDELSLVLLELFSIKFGENPLFRERDEFWPLNDSIIYSKPILKYQQEYFSFGIALFYRNLINILGDLIQSKSQGYYLKSFLKMKAKILGKLSLKYLGDLLPGAKVYSELYYHVEKNGENILCETDGLILFDENLFIIEAKAHKLSLSARRGSLQRIEKTAKQIIDEAYNQAIRCKKYIIEKPIAKFYDKKKRNILTINNKDYRSIYLINTTFEDLHLLSAQLHELKNFNLIKQKEWPWTVFINNLRVISEIVESPSIFILYLQRRELMNNNELFLTSDELDYFMLFLNKGLFFGDVNQKKNKKLSLVGLTDELYRYYSFKQGVIPYAQKPVFNISDEFKRFIYELEKTSKKGFTLAAISLLGLNTEDQERFLYLLTHFKEMSFLTGEDYKMFFLSQVSKRGLLFVIRTNASAIDWTKYREFLDLMMYQYKINQGILYKCVFKEIFSNIPNIDFEIIEKKWEFNLELNNKVKKNDFRRGMKTFNDEKHPL